MAKANISLTAIAAHGYPLCDEEGYQEFWTGHNVFGKSGDGRLLVSVITTLPLAEQIPLVGAGYSMAEQDTQYLLSPSFLLLGLYSVVPHVVFRESWRRYGSHLEKILFSKHWDGC